MEDNKLYKVVRYFDSYPDGLVKSNLDYETAKKLADELNSRNNRYLVEYLVRNDNIKE